MYALFVSDLHLTDRESDEYRWHIFDQLHEIGKAHGLYDLFLLGDLTEFKDYHSSKLVNRLVDELWKIRRNGGFHEIYILKGNHDGLDPKTPYFRFLNKLPWCHFYTEPTRLEKGADSILLLPHTRDPEKDWAGIEMDADFILLHGTVTGAVAEAGVKLEGIPLDYFKGLRSTILAGDIHVPQVVGKCVEYVGAPYPIRFGDEFQPRVIAVVGRKRKSIRLETLRKITLRVGFVEGPVQELYGEEGMQQVRRGDHVKVVIELPEAELGEFHDVKRYFSHLVEEAGAKLLKVQLVKKQGKKPRTLTSVPSPSSARAPEEEFALYCKRNKVPRDLEELGTQLLKE